MVRADRGILSGMLALTLAAAVPPAAAHDGAVAWARPLSGIAVDGDLSDWPAQVVAYPLDRVPAGAAIGPVDFEGTFRVAWDRAAGALYAGVEFDDAELARDGEIPATWDDLQRLFGRGRRRRDGPPPTLADGCALLLDAAHADEDGRPVRIGVDGAARSLFDLARRERLEWPGVDAAMALRAGRRTCEFRVDLRAPAWLGPRDALVPGTVLAFDVTATDRDADGAGGADHPVWIGWSAASGRGRGWGLRPAGDLVLLDAAPPGAVAGRARWDVPAGGLDPGPPPVAVQARSAGGAVLTALAAADGRFAVSLPAGRYTLWAEDDRLGSDRRRVAATVRPGQTTADVEVADEALFVLRPPEASPARRPLPEGRQRGLSWVGSGMVGRQEVEALAPVHVDWIAQTPFGWQRQADAPTLSEPRSEAGLWGESDRGVVVTARLARQRGIATLLKPHIWMGRGGWPGQIAMTTEADWAAWFAQYERFLLHYAKLAEAAGIEGLCIGTELAGTQQREAQWRRLIARVRQVYGGWLVYAANWDAFEGVPFWDALDYVGVQAYFPLAAQPTASVDSLVAGWQPWLARLEAVSRRVGRPLLFTEIGYRTGIDAAVAPWLWERQVEGGGDEAGRRTQQACYEAYFRAAWDRPWVAGAYFWKWFPHHDRAGGDGDESFTPQNKPAEQVLARWYGRQATAAARAAGPMTEAASLGGR